MLANVMVCKKITIACFIYHAYMLCALISSLYKPQTCPHNVISIALLVLTVFWIEDHFWLAGGSVRGPDGLV